MKNRQTTDRRRARWLTALMPFAFIASMLSPLLLVSCGGGGGGSDIEMLDDEDDSRDKKRTASKRKKKSDSKKEKSGSRKSSSSNDDAIDELDDLFAEAKDLGANDMFASAYRSARKYFNDGKDEDDASKAKKKFDRARRAIESVIEDAKDAQKEIASAKKLKEKAAEKKAEATKLGADKLAPDDFKDAEAELADANDALSDGDPGQASEAYEAAIQIFDDAIEAAKENQALVARAEQERGAMDAFKTQAKAADADTKAIDDWLLATQQEREGDSNLEQGNFQAAISSYKQATQGYVAALKAVKSDAELAEMMEKADAAAKAFREQELALAAKKIDADTEKARIKAEAQKVARRNTGTAVIPPGASAADFQKQMAKQALSTVIAEFQPELYPQELDEEDEQFLRDNYQKLASALTYDPDTGAAVLDYMSSKTMSADWARLYNSLRRKKYLSFTNPMGGEGSELQQSFLANTEGTLLILVPFKFRVRVEWDMSIQTMDASGKFHCILMYDAKKKSHYRTDWIHWQAAPLGKPKTVRLYPNKEFQGSANYWFDKTRDVPMLVEFKMPGGDIESTEPTLDELHDSALLKCVYNRGLDEHENTYTSSSPFEHGGFVGFQWNRTKFTVKKLKITGILDKQKAVDLLRKKLGKKKKTSSRKKKPVETAGGDDEDAEEEEETEKKPKVAGPDDFDL